MLREQNFDTGAYLFGGRISTLVVDCQIQHEIAGFDNPARAVVAPNLICTPLTPEQ